MPQSLSSVYVHAVFSTKDRVPYLAEADALREAHAFLGGVSKRLGCQPLIVGGVADHVHVLAALGRSVSQAEWIKELKRASSLHLKAQDPRFAWQSGYAIVSVDPSRLDQVRHYVANQEEHHHTVPFQDELRALLQEHGLEWNEDHLWD